MTQETKPGAESERLEMIEQAFSEMKHAHFKPNWFTKGEQGATQQFLLWWRKGIEAAKELRAAIEANRVEAPAEPVAFKAVEGSGKWHVLILDLKRWAGMPHGSKLYASPIATTASPPEPIEFSDVPDTELRRIERATGWGGMSEHQYTLALMRSAIEADRIQNPRRAALSTPSAPAEPDMQALAEQIMALPLPEPCDVFDPKLCDFYSTDQCRDLLRAAAAMVSAKGQS